MIYKIFIGVLVLFCAYVGYDAIAVSMAKSRAMNAEDSVLIAPADADVTVVEFLDYACGHCKDLHPILSRALSRDGKVKLIIRPLPSSQSESGTAAAKLLYAAARQGKLSEAHELLIENYRPIDDAFIENFAVMLALDTVQLLEDYEDPKIIDILNENIKTIQALKAQSVPSLLINGDMLLQVSDTLPDTQALLDLFNRARTL